MAKQIGVKWMSIDHIIYGVSRTESGTVVLQQSLYEILKCPTVRAHIGPHPQEHDWDNYLYQEHWRISAVNGTLVIVPATVKEYEIAGNSADIGVYSHKGEDIHIKLVCDKSDGLVPMQHLHKPQASAFQCMVSPYFALHLYGAMSCVKDYYIWRRKPNSSVEAMKCRALGWAGWYSIDVESEDVYYTVKRSKNKDVIVVPGTDFDNDDEWARSKSCLVDIGMMAWVETKLTTEALNIPISRDMCGVSARRMYSAGLDTDEALSLQMAGL
jgi:hypothetical protein